MPHVPATTLAPPGWTAPPTVIQENPSLLKDFFCQSITESSSLGESYHCTPSESKVALCHSHRLTRGVAGESGAEVFPFGVSSSSHASRHDFLFPPCSTHPSLHASVFNGCCQKGYQANMFSVFGNGSYELRLLPDSILVWA